MRRAPHPLDLVRWTVLLLGTLTLLACGRLEPPRLTPRSLEVTKVSALGMRVRVELDAYNPNRIGLSVREVSATVKLEGGITLGRASVDTETALPARKTTRIESELVVPWTHLAQVASLARRQDRVRYTLEGHARIGGRLSVEVPFTLDGEVTSQQVLQATLRGLPGLDLF